MNDMLGTFCLVLGIGLLTFGALASIAVVIYGAIELFRNDAPFDKAE